MPDERELRFGDCLQVWLPREWRREMEQHYYGRNIDKARAFEGRFVLVLDSQKWRQGDGRLIRCHVVGSGETVDLERGCLRFQDESAVPVGPPGEGGAQDRGD